MKAAVTDATRLAMMSEPKLPPEPESMRKLRALKERIMKEHDSEKAEREAMQNGDPVLPLSLSTDADNQHHQSKTSATLDRQGNDTLTVLKDKILHIKIDRTLQKELEVELESRFSELGGLKSHNRRLRDILALRESSNTRKEAKLEDEIAFLKNLMDDACLQSRDHDTMMGRLRELNTEIQDKSLLLKSTIEDKAEAERLALIRTYRVRMRDVKQQLAQQEAMNLEGAKAWISRFEMLDQDREIAAQECATLEVENAAIKDHNKELRVMQKHQNEQRADLTQKIATLKRENRRLEEQEMRLEKKLHGETDLEGSTRPPTSATRASSRSGGISRPGSRARPGTGSINQMGSRSGGRPASSASTHDSSFGGDGPSERDQAKALASIRKVLESIRTSLKKVRGAQIELLQERSELEMFMRQCIEDVRRDVYRFTVASSVNSSSGTASKRASAKAPLAAEEAIILESYGVKEKKQLMDILNGKLHVYTLLHQKMFPKKPLHEVLGAYIPSADAVENEEDEDQQDEAVDELWGKWKDWTRSNTPVLK